VFLIQSLPRCGTHLLRTLLESHPQITCFGEVFNPESVEHGFPVNLPSVTDVIDYCNSKDNPTGFVAHAYVGLNKEEKSFGFGHGFLQRPDVKAAAGLWQCIPSDAAVITLRRENLLARYVSHLVARSRKTWICYQEQKVPEVTKIRINCREMLDDFNMISKLTTIAEKRFPHALFISYEELALLSSDVLIRIQNHLGVEVHALKPRTLKVGKPLKETIVNYKDVQKALRGTPYGQYLETTL
jgi:hypothetical protein